MPLSIRAARESDIEVLADYNIKLAWESEAKRLDPPTVRAGVAAMLADPAKGFYFVAEDAYAVVGQLAVTREWSDWRNGDFWWIQSVYVAESARRLGVFRALYQHILAAARQRGDVIGVRLYVEHDNSVAQATYRKLGMTMTSYHVMEMCPIDAPR